MGEVMQIKLPYVYPERMKSGRTRYRWQKNGKKVTMPGQPGSKEFMDKYHELMDTVPTPAVERSLQWLCDNYVGWLDRQVDAGNASILTLRNRRNLLKHICLKYGRKHMDMPKRAVIEYLDDLAETPSQAQNTLKALRALYKWAGEREIVTVNPTVGVPNPKAPKGGFKAWTLDEVRQFRKVHPYGTTPHLCLSLAIYTAARRSDLVKLGRFNERAVDGQPWLHWTQTKAPHGAVEIPMLPQLLSEVREHGGDSVYLVNQYGRPFTVAGLGTRFGRWAQEAKVTKRLHGIRKSVPSLLAEQGVSSTEIMVLLGHSNRQQGEVYTQAADRRVIADSVMKRVADLKW